jgi:multidrug transporter EmrE-like cation transporter
MERAMPTSNPQNAIFAWTGLVAAGLLEVVWAIALRYSDGFARWG